MEEVFGVGEEGVGSGGFVAFVGEEVFGFGKEVFGVGE